MKDFLIKAILQPFLAILFCLVFGLPFSYVGFQSINIQGSKDESGEVSLDLTRKHFFGLYTFREHIEGAEYATLDTNLVRRTGNRRFLASGVFIETDSEVVRLVAGSSNTDDKIKWEMFESINDYIDSSAVLDYDQTFRVSNIFGWFGLPFLVLGMLGLVGWPSSIWRHWKDR